MTSGHSRESSAAESDTPTCTCLCSNRSHLTDNANPGLRIQPGHCDLCRSAPALLEALEGIMAIKATGLATQVTTTIGMMAQAAIKLAKGD